MPMYVNAKTMSLILDLSERRVNQLVTEGTISKEADGNFNVMQAVIEYNNKKNGLEPGVSYAIEHALLEKAKRETAEIELAVLKGEVHKADDIKQGLAVMIITCRNKLLAMPATVVVRLMGQKNPNVVIDILTKEIKIALNELSEYDASAFVSDVNGN